MAFCIAGLILALPILQLLPLPPAIWNGLPGRELMAGSLELVGRSNDWRPVSIAPHKTLASMLALGPPLLVLILTASAKDSQLRKGMAAILVLAIAASVLGAFQVASAGQAGHLYEATHRGWVTGFFANRNAAADLFVIAILAASALGLGKPETQGARKLPFGAVALSFALLAVAGIMTGSRVGAALLVVVGISGLIVAITRGRQFSARRTFVASAAVGAALMATVAAGWYAGGLRQVAARFGATSDMRAEIWPDTVHAIERFWPAGSGLGTFQEAFAASQRLETVGPAVINRAHNDFLELALEGGPLALILLAVITALLLRNALVQWRAAPAIRARLIFAGASLTVLAAHSLVDYPLRSIALAVICAFGAGILAKLPRAS